MKQKIHVPPSADGMAWLTGQSLRRMASHHHEELELNLVLTGKAHYLFEHRRVSIAAGFLLWIFPRQEHVLFDWSPDFSMWVVVIKPRLVRRLTEPSDRRILRSPDPSEIFCRQINASEVDALDRIYRDAMRPADDPELARSALGYALIRSWQTYQFSRESIPRTDVHPAVARAARVLSLTDDAISLDELAAKAGLSPARLSRLFKSQVGIPITAFRQQECLKRFLGLYRTGARYSLIEAALLAGFGSYPQFHRVFRRLMGISPGAYKSTLKPASPIHNDQDGQVACGKLLSPPL
jgi:AraC-like DNA-binding protein